MGLKCLVANARSTSRCPSRFQATRRHHALERIETEQFHPREPTITELQSDRHDVKGVGDRGLGGEQPHPALSAKQTPHPERSQDHTWDRTQNPRPTGFMNSPHPIQELSFTMARTFSCNRHSLGLPPFSCRRFDAELKQQAVYGSTRPSIYTSHSLPTLFL